MTRIRVGIDTGGTFTDVVALDTETGRLVSTKTPSTPRDPAEGFLTGLRQGLELLGLEPAPRWTPASCTAPRSRRTTC